ncbi:alanine racemase [Phytohabitans sp. LJ34]|uniref:alanine racemase n=1 Tax=Phytohabitans sp. LJ34 TaxID=3452217 RepID=UPI003F88FBAB
MTPRVTVDPERLDANLIRFGAAARAAGVVVRAHVKGHRTVAIGVRQVAAGAVGIAVHSAAEARWYVDAGVSDVVIAWPWRDAWRWPRFARLARHARVAVHVDRGEALAGLSAAAAEQGVTLGVRVEVDTGLHRTGVAPEEVVSLAKAAASTPGLRLDGVTGYVPVLTARDAADRYTLGQRVARQLVDVAGAVRDAGLPCQVVSVGGTVTAPGALSVPGVTELCSGAYALLDGGHAMLGACRPQDVAIAVTTAVTAVAPDGSISTDADELLAGADQVWAPGVRMTDASGTPRVGGPLRVLPAHVCPVVARCPPLHLPDGTVWRPRVAPDRP